MFNYYFLITFHISGDSVAHHHHIFFLKLASSALLQPTLPLPCHRESYHFQYHYHPLLPYSINKKEDDIKLSHIYKCTKSKLTFLPRHQTPYYRLPTKFHSASLMLQVKSYGASTFPSPPTTTSAILPSYHRH